MKKSLAVVALLCVASLANAGTKPSWTQKHNVVGHAVKVAAVDVAKAVKLAVVKADHLAKFLF